MNPINLAALSFAKGYSQLELVVLGGVAMVVVCLLGLMANAILSHRGVGIFGNSIVLGLGAWSAFLFHDFLVRQPAYISWALPQGPVIVGLIAVWMMIFLVGAASIKRRFS